MNKVFFFAILLLSIAACGLQAQTLVSVITIIPQNIEIDGKSVEDVDESGKMLLPNNKSKVVLYQNNDLTYWAEFNIKQCGKKASLSSKTYVELKDGSVIHGSRNKSKMKLEKGSHDWFVGSYEDDFEKDLALKADFEYNVRVTN